MTQISTLAIDLAKHSFQVCATTSEGEIIYNRKLSRAALKKFLAEHSPCLVRNGGLRELPLLGSFCYRLWP